MTALGESCSPWHSRQGGRTQLGSGRELYLDSWFEGEPDDVVGVIVEVFRERGALLVLVVKGCFGQSCRGLFKVNTTLRQSTCHAGGQS